MLLLLIIILTMVILLLMLKMMLMPIQLMPMLKLDPSDANTDDEDWQVCEPKVFLGQMRSH